MINNTMKTKKSGQIMVIVLLLLSILSIVALTATLTTVRDSQESLQNKQYQQYYSLGERKILDIQQFLGYSGLNTLTNGTVEIPSEAGEASNANCSISGNGTKAECTFEKVSSSEVGGGESTEELDIYSLIEDTNYILDHEMQKDQDILLTLGNGINTTYLFWDNQADVAWSVTYDYKNSSNEYISEKEIYDSFSPPKLFGASTISTANNCLVITDAPTANEINVAKANMGVPTRNFTRVLKISKQTIPSCNTALYFRLRPLRQNSTDTVSFSLYKVDNSTPLQRKITTITSTSAENSATQAEDTPTAVLESSYLLTYSPLSLFDYVLRTENGIRKN